MTLTIRECENKAFIVVSCIEHSHKADEFRKYLGRDLRVPTNNIYNLLGRIASFVNDNLGEECLFELD